MLHAVSDLPTNEAAVKQPLTKCPRCGAWSAVERCPQCGAHRMSVEPFVASEGEFRDFENSRDEPGIVDQGLPVRKI